MRLRIIDDATPLILEVMRRASQSMRDLRPLWRGYKRPWYRSRQRQLDTQGASTGQRWSPGPPRYRLAKARILGVSAAAVDTLVGDWRGTGRRLQPSLTDPAHPESVYSERPASVDAGSSVPYALAVHTGGQRLPAWAGGGTSSPIPILRTGGAFERDAGRATDQWVGLVYDVVEGRRRVVPINAVRA